MTRTPSAIRQYARIARPFAISIVLGALTTIAVAWSCAAWPVPNFRGIKRSIAFDRDREEAHGEGRGYLTLHGAYEFGTLSLYGVASQQGIGGRYYNYNPRRSLPDLPRVLRCAAQPWLFGEPWPPDGVEDQRSVSVAGWPLLALYAVSGDRSDVTRPTPFTGFRTPRWFCGDSMLKGPRLYYLPTTPLPVGFLANSAFFAAPWFMLLFAPGMLRRGLRRCRGRCTRCAYDLSATQPGWPCPECGQRVPD